MNELGIRFDGLTRPLGDEVVRPTPPAEPVSFSWEPVKIAPGVASPAAPPASEVRTKYGEQVFGLLAAAFLLFALARGGSSADAVSIDLVKLASAPLLGVAAWRLLSRPLGAGAWPLSLLACAFAIGALQLIPTPPQVWQALGGRQTVAAAYQALGMTAPWLPVSLTPQATLSTLTGLIPAAAMFVAMLSLGHRSRRWLVWAVLLGAGVSLVLAILQSAGGYQSPWRLYPFTDATAAVGAFANRNHQGVFLAAMLPLCALMFARGHARSTTRRPAWLLTGFIAMVMLAVGVAAAQSRAGVVLAAPAAIGAALVALRASGRDGRAASWAPMAAVGAALALAAALVAVLNHTPLSGRFAAGLDDELRLQLTPIVLQAGQAFVPLGAGLGSFGTVYPMFERPESITGVFVNHAHNDYVELWLEAGWPGVALAVAVVALWGVRFVVALWRERGVGTADRLAGGIIVGLLLAHSAVDYPLRTPALAVLFALACGLMTPVAMPKRRQNQC